MLKSSDLEKISFPLPVSPQTQFKLTQGSQKMTRKRKNSFVVTRLAQQGRRKTSRQQMFRFFEFSVSVERTKLTMKIFERKTFVPA